MQTLYTERLIIRQWKINDLDDMYQYCRNPIVGPMAGWKPHQNRQESALILDKFIKGNEVWAIQLRSNGRVIGSIGLHKTNRRLEQFKVLELGYVLGEDYWGQGLMTEACSEVIKYAFEQEGVDMLVVGHFDFNNRSRRVIEKLGFIYEAHLRNIYQLKGEMHGESLYSMTREEYNTRKQSNPNM
ncbi:MAG: GNAT family N-acetyltransferase [Clostridia bacterium]|nr:GNAT family N-acetyltransferase [Clostridia bacterium]